MFENFDTEIRTLSLDEIDFVSGGAPNDKAKEDRTKDYITGENGKAGTKQTLQERVREEDELHTRPGYSTITTTQGNTISGSVPWLPGSPVPSGDYTIYLPPGSVITGPD